MYLYRKRCDMVDGVIETHDYNAYRIIFKLNCAYRTLSFFSSNSYIQNPTQYYNNSEVMIYLIDKKTDIIVRCTETFPFWLLNRVWMECMICVCCCYNMWSIIELALSDEHFCCRCRYTTQYYYDWWISISYF